MVSERQPVGGYQMMAETTLEFATRHGLNIAINGGNFQGFRGNRAEHYGIKIADGTHGDLVHISQGDVINPYGNPRKALYISKDNQVSVREPVGEPWNAISGKNNMLVDGYRVESLVFHDARHPRTAVGLSEDRRFMWWLIIEGRQPGHADGVYMDELYAMFVQLGAYNAMNWDGGGSTTLVMDGQIINDLPPQERQGIGRAIGNSIGAWLSCG